MALIAAGGAAIVSVIVGGADKSVCSPVRSRGHPPPGLLAVPQEHLAAADIPVNLLAYCRRVNAEGGVLQLLRTEEWAGGGRRHTLECQFQSLLAATRGFFFGGRHTAHTHTVLMTLKQ